MSNNLRGCLYAVMSSASYGVNAFALLLYDHGVTTETVLFYRYFFAVLFLLGLMLIRRESLRLSLREFAIICPMGILFAFSSLSLFESYKYLGASLSATALFVYPALVAIIMWLVFRESPGRVTLFAIPAVFFGIVLLDWQGIWAGTSSPLGLVIVFSSALSYAIYMVVVQKSRLARMSSLKLSFYSLFFGWFLFIAKTGFCADVQILHSATDWSIVVMLAVFPSLVSLATMATAIRLVGSTATAVLGAFEPLTSVLIGISLLGERPPLVSFVGMVIILLSVTAVIAQRQLNAYVSKLLRHCPH
ncbi:MAG: DMT family transporter [Bacteroidales bacterium]|nr:DMT family transporter [Bacteroidales bacterium]